MELKKTALHDVHSGLGARMMPFAGFDMPLKYTSETEEHHTVRNGVGVFDVSHMGEFLVSGPNALELLQKTTSNDVATLTPGKVQYSCFPNEDGGIIDDLLVYCLAPQRYMLVVNASNTEKDWLWLGRHNANIGAETDDISHKISLFAVQGPKAVEALQPLTQHDLASMEYYTCLECTFAGAGGIIVSATGYTGAGGFEIYVPNQFAKAVWDKIFEAGAPFGIKPVGLAARDTLRLEKGFCLYGNDIDDTTSPISAGLGWITKFNKPFINAEALKAEKEAGPAQRLVGLEMVGKGIARQGYAICDSEGRAIGRITSGTMSPSLGKAIALGYVPAGMHKPGTKVFVDIRQKPVEAVVAKLPFLKK